MSFVEVNLREAAELLSRVDTSKPNDVPGSKRDRVEYGLVLCYVPGRDLKPILGRGQVDQIDLAPLIASCYRQGGKPILLAHTHPRSAAIPSTVDVVELLRAIDQGFVKPEFLYCIARRGEKYVLNCVLVRSRDDVVKLAVAAAETTRRANAQNPVPTREDPILTETEAQLREDLFVQVARELGLEVYQVKLDENKKVKI